MLTIDLHTHILPEDWPLLDEKFGYGGFVRLEKFRAGDDRCCARMWKDGRMFREVMDNCWEPRARIADMDGAAVHAQVLSTVPVMFSYWAKPEDALELARLLNDHIARVCAEYPDRFVGLCTLPMQAPDLAARELERCVKHLGFRGVQIGSHVEANSFTGRTHDWNLSDPAVVEVLAEAQRLDAAVFVHPWDMMGREQMPRYWLPWLVGMPAETCRAICSVMFGGVFEKLPGLRIGFAHGGGSFPCTVGRIVHGWSCRPDLVACDNPRDPREYLRDKGAGRTAKFYVDSLVHDHYNLRALIGMFGPERIAMGSDYPFPLGEARPGELARTMPKMSDVALRRILGGTALEFLGLDAARFGRAGEGVAGAGR